jgi:hypothetical protein
MNQSENSPDLLTVRIQRSGNVQLRESIQRTFFHVASGESWRYCTDWIELGTR